jgi:hypothetical protein
MNGINIISIVLMENEGMNEHKCESTIEFGITTIRQRGSVMETAR